MTIRVVRNNAGNCVNFIGTTNPAYWNACLSAEVDEDDPTRINIINDIRTQLETETVYEFFKIPFTEFVDADGSGFTTAQDTAEYITEKANVVGSTGSFVFRSNDTVDFQRDATNTSILVNNGDYFPVNAIKAIEDTGTITIMELVSSGTILYQSINHSNVYINDGLVGGTVANVVNELNALFTVTPLGGGTDAVTVFPVSGTTSINASSNGTIDPIGSAIAGDDTTVAGYGRYWSTDFIRNPGEYFLVKMTGRGRFTIGLYEDGVDTDLSRQSTNGHSDQLWSQAFYNYGSYLGPWTLYGRRASYSGGPGWSGPTNERFATNTDIQDANAAGDPYLLKIGIDANGYLNVWYYDEGRSNDFIQISRTSYTLTEGNYGLMIKFFDTASKLYELPTRAAVDPTLSYAYRYIESPDGSFYYPLFATTIEASGVDVLNGGSGTYHSHIFLDEPTMATWYMPDSVQNHAVSAAPVDTSAIAYTAIPTEADSLYAPAAFTINDLTVNEGGAVNYQISPQDVSYVTTVSGLPEGLSFLNGYLVDGTAPQVASDYNTNPSDDYTITVTRTNSFGSASTTFTLTVNNLTAPATAIAGFTWNSSSVALVDASTMDSSSVVSLDNTLNKPRRFIFPQNWVESYVLPRLFASGDEIWLGVKDGSGVLTDGIVPGDWDAYIKWEWNSATSHKSIISADTSSSVIINSLTDSFYDYAFEADADGNLYVIACNVNDINSQPGVNYGGAFNRTVNTSGGGVYTLELATNGVQMTLSDSELSEIVIPAAPRWIQVNAAAHVLSFDGSSAMPTLNAGYTYRFLMADVNWADQTTNTGLQADDDIRFTADGSTEYTSGITRFSDPNSEFAYVEFAVPADAPPLWWYTDHNGISQDNAVTIAGSTYVTPVTGITLEGPVANQTGSNLFDIGDHGWLSIDEDLAAGERLVMDTTFGSDLLTAMPNNSRLLIGLKDTGWSNTDTGVTLTNFIGDIYYQFDKNGSGAVLARVLKSQTVIGSQVTIPSNQLNLFRGFLEISNGGGVVRAAWTTNTGMGSDEATTAYDDWFWSTKVATSNLSVTNAEVVVLGRDTGGGVAMDSADVDWTGLSEVSVPQPAATLTTPWTKALDFGGSSERAQMVSQSSSYNALRMRHFSGTVAANSTPGFTSDQSSANPWATAIVFKPDGNNSNQHIWNCGEGAGDTDDNIYLRVDANGNLYFGWGRSGALNECVIGAGFNAGAGINQFWGIYIAHNGTRLSGTNATASNLAACFDIRIMNNQGGTWQIAGAGGTFADAVGNRSTVTNWSRSGSRTGGRMDRRFDGDFTIGGRGANRSFHGKVAAMTVTTLQRGVAMPDDAEIRMLITDPDQWISTYRVGQFFRTASSSTAIAWNSASLGSRAQGVQMWLMGDTSTDAYAKIRNRVHPSEQNYTPLNMISMVSNDIENVTIPGLT